MARYTGACEGDCPVRSHLGEVGELGTHRNDKTVLIEEPFDGATLLVSEAHEARPEASDDRVRTDVVAATAYA